jgi:hypothetical protein
MEMIGGLMKTSRFAIAAAASVLATNAMAADLGGNCCADLEERVADLEATAARKGNRRVSLTVSGHVNEALMWWDDGDERNAYVVTNNNSRTRFRFVGDAKITADWSAGYLLEIGVRNALSSSVSQLVDDPNSTLAALDLRHSAWWIENAKLGRLWVGKTSNATDGITEINLSNAGTPFGGPDMSNWQGSFFLRESRTNRLLAEQTATSFPSIAAVRGITWNNIAPATGDTWNTGDGFRFNEIKYVSPTFWGFNWSWAWGEDDFWDTALRYAGEFNSIRVAAGIGYERWLDGNANSVLPTTAFGSSTAVVGTGSQGALPCADLDFGRFGVNTFRGRGHDVDCEGVGMSASIMHVPTGLYVAGSYGYVQDNNRADLFADRLIDTAFAGNTGTVFGAGNIGRLIRNADDRDDHWFIQGGIEKNWFGLGKTTLFADYAHFNQGIGVTGQNISDFNFLFTPIGPFSTVDGAFIRNSSVSVWGFGLVQTIDAAAMDLYIGFRNFSGDADLVVVESRNVGTPGEPVFDRRVRTRALDIQDFQAVMAGGIIRF